MEGDLIADFAEEAAKVLTVPLAVTITDEQLLMISGASTDPEHTYKLAKAIRKRLKEFYKLSMMLFPSGVWMYSKNAMLIEALKADRVKLAATMEREECGEFDDELYE